MTFTIGRASFAGSPYDLRHDGDRLSFAIDIDTESASTVAEAKVLRQQVLGLANNADEPVVPVTWSDDSDLDGFYRVGRVEVAPFPVFLANGFAPCRIDLERVGGGYAKPVTEVQTIASDRGNGPGNHTAAGTGSLVWCPDAATWSDFGLASGTSISSATGSIRGFTAGTRVNGFVVAAGDFYDGSAVIEQQVSGSWYPVIGVNVSPGAAVRVSNGIIRCQWNASGEYVVDVFNGATWDEVERFVMALGGTDTAPLDTPVILRNGPDTVTVGFPTEGSSAGFDEYWRTSLSVRRGEPFVSMVSTLPDSASWSITPNTSAAAQFTDSTPFIGSVTPTSADGNGHLWIMGTTIAFSLNTSTGVISHSSADTPMPWFIGVKRSGESRTATAISDSWWTAVSETQRVVSR